MRIAIISFTQAGGVCSGRLLTWLRDQGMEADGFTASAESRTLQKEDRLLQPVEGTVRDWTGQAFACYDALIYIGAAAIAVRSVAPYIRDKWTDPAVLVMDEKGQYVIPILSGHVGGANALAMRVAGFLGAQPVITTATDVQGLFAVDVFAVRNGLKITSREKAKAVSADIVRGQILKLYLDRELHVDPRQIPEELTVVRDRLESRIAVDYHRADNGGQDALLLIPEGMLWIGIGCRRGTPAEAVEAALEQLLAEQALCESAVAGMASIDLKKEEQGIRRVCEQHRWPYRTFSPETLNQLEGTFTASEFVREQTGVDNVCERAALLAAGAGGRLLVRKRRFPGITLAVAGMDRRIRFE